MMKNIPLATLATLMLGAVAIASADDTSPQSKGSSIHSLSKLGHSLGTYLKIEGVKLEPNGKKLEPRILIVDTVNGKKLEEPVSINIENVTELPSNIRCVLKGYETGGMVGTPPAHREAAKELGLKNFVVGAQIGERWYWDSYFIVLIPEAPRDLPIKYHPSAPAARASKRNTK